MGGVGARRDRRVWGVVTDDEPHELGLVDPLVCLEAADDLSLPEDRGAVALRQRLGEVVGDEDHPDALGGQ